MLTSNLFLLWAFLVSFPTNDIFIFFSNEVLLNLIIKTWSLAICDRCSSLTKYGSLIHQLVFLLVH